jgi:cytochrome b pre-mRNA-processing protein 3
MILARWFGRGPGDRTSRAVYDRIVAQARAPAFYASLGVPDTPEGRFEMLALHLFLVLHRLKRERNDPAMAGLAQRLADHLVADMDANLREMGAGDLGVGRRVKRMAGALYGRIAAYEAGFDAGEAALAHTLRRTVFATATPADAQVAATLRYLLAARDRLAARPAADLAQGTIDFPTLSSTSQHLPHSIPPPLVGGG